MVPRSSSAQHYLSSLATIPGYWHLFSAIRLFCVLLLALALAGCSSLGDFLTKDQGTPSAPSRAETPTGPDLLPSVSLERERSVQAGLAQIAWSPSSYTGQGVVVAVIDTGIETAHEEFTGAIDAASQNFYPGAAPADLEDDFNHGTGVAGIIGARENGKGMVGVAPDARLLVLKTDEAGSIDPDAVNAALRFATQQGAAVTNISMAYYGAIPEASKQIIRDALASGMFLAVAAGNDGADTPTHPAVMAQITGDGALLAVGAVDGNNLIADFSNRAGATQDFFLVAPGVNQLMPITDNSMGYASGTSFAAPFVSGAAAVLLSKDPHLTGAQLASILLETATDLGDAGVDPIYGHGLVNLEAALQPVGQTRIVTGASVDGAASRLGDTQASYSAAFAADRLGASLRSVLALDSYDRSYAVDIAPSVQPVAAPLLSRWSKQAVFGFSNTRAAQSDDTLGLTLGLASTADGQGFFSAQGEVSPALRLTLSLGERDAWRWGGDHLERRASTALRRDDFARLQGQSLALDGRLALTPAFEAHVGAARAVGDDLATLSAQDAQRPIQDTLTFGLAYQARDLELGVTTGLLYEPDSLLGAALGGAMGAYQDEQTRYLTIDGQLPLAGAWQLGGHLTLGQTAASYPGGLIQEQSSLLSSGFDLGLARSGLVFGDGSRQDQLRLSLSQPLRLESGYAIVRRPTARRRDGAIDIESQTVSLVPQSRQIDLSLGYGLFDAQQSAGLDLLAGLSLNPDHVRQAPDYSLALRYRRDF